MNYFYMDSLLKNKNYKVQWNSTLVRILVLYTVNSHFVSVPLGTTRSNPWAQKSKFWALSFVAQHPSNPPKNNLKLQLYYLILQSRFSCLKIWGLAFILLEFSSMISFKIYSHISCFHSLSRNTNIFQKYY